MTQKDPGTDFNPKHRILGAVILVTAAVIFVPMILNERESLETVAGVPAPVGEDQQPEQVKVVVTDLRRPAAEPTPAKPVPPPAAATPAQTEEAPKPATATAPTAKTNSSVSKPATSPEPAKTAPKVEHGWVVQVGTFANVTNAERLEAKLRQEGHAVRTERVTLDAGKAVRLQVGPFRDKALAIKAQTRIQKDIGVQGVVLAYP